MQTIVLAGRHIKRSAIRVVHLFPKGSIWQTRYICLPAVLVITTLALSNSSLGYLARGLWFLSGVLLWSLLEYVIHRWVFHYRPHTEIGSALLDRFHVLHHDDPHDQTQVCIPFLANVLFWGWLFANFILFGGGWDASLLVTCGIALMMVVYDICHYSTHYMRASNRLLKVLKKHHMLHHFSDHTKRFGVTSPLWDYVFRTI